MSEFRECAPMDHNRNCTFDDRRIIDQLILSDKLTDREKQALDHLYYAYNYARD